ncbi:MAG: hypothetical protein N2438_11615 [Limisphaera sp.]|nr:hypothetical protein [Limisphaera sp.]
MRSRILGWLLLLVLWSAVTGCRCPQPEGSREYRPGKGWVPVR